MPAKTAPLTGNIITMNHHLVSDFTVISAHKIVITNINAHALPRMVMAENELNVFPISAARF